MGTEPYLVPLLLPPGCVRCVNFKHRIHVIGNWVNPEVATFCCCCQRSRVLLLLEATAYRVHLPRCHKFVIPKDPSYIWLPPSQFCTFWKGVISFREDFRTPFPFTCRIYCQTLNKSCRVKLLTRMARPR
jgi:hypothetical protein